MSKKNSNVSNKKIDQFIDKKLFSLLSNKLKKKLKNLKNKKILVAVSGGPDSLALSILTKSLETSLNLNIYYVLIDHGIRKKSYLEGVKTRLKLKKFGIKLNIIKNHQKIKNNIQSKAREIRYQLLSNFCKKKNINYLMTAHHSEDQVETFLIRLSRGSGVQGLSSMKIVTKLKSNLKIVRPLLDVKKKDLMHISKLVFGKYINDPSNKNPKFLRTKIRKLIKEMEKSGIGHEKILKSISNLSMTSETLENYLKLFEKKSVKKSKSNFMIKFSDFLQVNKEIQFRVLQNILVKCSKNYYPPRSEKIFSLIERLKKKKSQKKQTLGNCIIFKQNKIIYVYKEPKSKKIKG